MGWIFFFATQMAQALGLYQVDVWQADNGLPQGTVTSIVQSPDGYLWLGTQNGLVRFDGVTFRVFDANNTPAIRNNRIVQLFVDHQGTLWIGAEQGNLIRYHEGQFEAYQIPGNGTTFNYARAICDDADRRLWVLSCEWRLMSVAHGEIAVPSANWGLSSLNPKAVASDEAGRVCVGTERELAVWQDGAFHSQWSQTNEAGFQVDFLATCREGGWWVAGNGRLRRFETNGFVEDRGRYAWTNQPVYGLYEDKARRVWVATLGGGLFRYDPDGAVLHLTTREGLPTDFVRCVMVDREGNIWVGTEGGGLCRLKSSLFETVGSQQGLASDQVMSACESGDGSYWIGLNGKGIDHWDHGRVEHYDAARGLMNGHVWSLLKDRQGTIWAGTWGGLFKLDRDQDRFVSVSGDGKIGGVVLAMYEDRAGDLWLGEQAFGALTRIRNQEISTLTIPGTSASLDVRAMAEDAAGGFWVGTENQGLFRRQNGEWSHFGKREGLENESIWSLYADGEGLWIGTCGGGLSRWRNGKIKTWTTRNGLVNDVICQILDDQKGNLWLGSYGGVFSVSKAGLTIESAARVRTVSYRKADGLPSIECQGGFQPAGFAARDGRLWFPTIRGFGAVNPGQIISNSVPPVVLTEDLLLDGVAQTFGGAGALRIPPGTGRLEIHYTATSLTAPEKVKFRYQLENWDQDWQEAGAKRTATYNRLGPGNYLFRVIACNNDGVWNDRGATQAIVVLPFFWQTGWFVFLSGMALVGVIFAAVRYVVTRRLHVRLERLEREQMVQRERARIAKDIHDDLGANLTEIAILGELAQKPETPVTEVRADVRAIVGKTKLLTQLLDEIVWALNPQRDTLENFVTYTCSYAEDFLRVARIQCRLELLPLAPEVSLSTCVRHGLFLVVKEALNNVVKHAGATAVEIRMEAPPGEFIISIRDNGCGFSQAVETTDAGDLPVRTVSGEGLGNMRQRVESLGGRYEISSRPGAGTQVRIQLSIKDGMP